MTSKEWITPDIFFQDTTTLSIKSVEFTQPYVENSKEEIHVSTENSSEIHYFIINSEGEIVLKGIEDITDNKADIKLDDKSGITQGVNTIKIFAAVDEVLKPFEYSKSFIVISDNKQIPNSEILGEVTETQED